MNLMLPTGKAMPVIGLGTWQAAPDVVENAVAAALDAGYRHFDTAFNYGNEEAVGRAIRNWETSGGNRNELFITTKLPNFGIRPGDVEKYIVESLRKLDMDYVDLYLIHHPFGFLSPPPGTEPPELDMSTDHLLTWKAMEAQVSLGRCRSIGLSNFNGNQIKRIAENASVPIANLQVELHAYLQQPELLKTCRDLGITVTAYAPLGSPTARSHIKAKYAIEAPDSSSPLEDPIVVKIASEMNVSPAQVLLSFLIELGVAIIPKSISPDRIKENFKSIEIKLNSEAITSLKTLDKHEKGRTFDFLFYKGVESHPEYPFFYPPHYLVIT